MGRAAVCSQSLSSQELGLVLIGFVSPGVKAISLPEPNQDCDDLNAVVTGWGELSLWGSNPDILQEVRLRTISNKQCRETKYEDEEITDFMICTEPGKGGCKGDSGGPLAVKGQDGKYFLIGIVSFDRGISKGGCALPGWPDVYTRVAAFTDWIENNKKQ